MAVQLISDEAMRSLIAHMPGVVAAVHKAAVKNSNGAKRRLAAHRETGAAQVTVTQGDVDSFVNLDDPAALSIQFGHFVGGMYFDWEKPKYVPGLYILREG